MAKTAVTGVYSFHAIDHAGRRIHGEEPAGSVLLAYRALEERGMLVLAVGSCGDKKAGTLPGISIRHSHRDILEITRALAALLPAGLPLARALGTAAEVAGPAVAGALHSVQQRVERGESLAAALAEHPGMFSPLYVGMVRAGERSGALTPAFQRLAVQLERDEQLRSRLISASIYPILLAVAGGIAVLVLLLLVIPRFVELLQGTGAALPRSTALVLALSTCLQEHWPLVLTIPTGLGLALAWIRTTDEGRRAGAQLLLGVPFLRSVRQNALGARFARLLGTLLGGGAPLLAALDDTLESLGDPVAKDETTRIRGQVREGVALHRAIADGGFFPPILVQLVTVGEESGQLQTFLLKAADILEERTERLLQRLVTLIEPAMIIVFGGLVGFVALSLLQAIYSVNAGSFR